MSRGKKAYLQYESQLSEAIARLAQLREELKAAIDADAESYNVVMKAYRAAKDAQDGGRAISAALEQATSVPLSVAGGAVEVEQIASGLRAITNPKMSSDLTTAVALAKAALAGALANVEVNLESMNPESAEDQAFTSRIRSRVAALESRS
jgi:formiminotetrahydrofolate cyclodeaminase